MRRNFGYAVILAVLIGSALHAVEFKSVWKSPNAGPAGFAGKKVVALIVSQDLAMRMSAEEALARQLEAIGVQGVAAYRMIPREELQNVEKAKGWFQEAAVEGVVAMRLVSAKTVKEYRPAMWTSGYYTTWWGYYGYTTAAVWDPGYLREDQIVTVETLVFSVRRDTLLFAALSETTNPKSIDAFMKDLVSKAVKEMKKAGLTGRQRT